MEEKSSDYSRGVDGLPNPSHESHSSRHSGNPDSEISASVNKEENEPPGRVDVDQVSQNSTTGSNSSNSSRTSYARPDLSNLSTGSSSAKIPIQNCPIARHIREGDLEGSVCGVDPQSLGGECENSSIVSIPSNDHTRDEDESGAEYDESDDVKYENLEEVPQQRKHEINPHVQRRELLLRSEPKRVQGDNAPDSSRDNDLSSCLDLASDLSLLDDIDDCCFMNDPLVAPSEFSSVTFHPDMIKLKGGGELEHVGDGYFLDRARGRLHYQRVGNVIHDFGSEGDHRGRFWTYNEFCVSNLRIEENMVFSWRQHQKGTLEYLTSLLEQKKNVYCHGFTESFWDCVVNDKRVKCFLKGNEISTMKRWSNDVMAMHKLLLVLFIRRKLELGMKEQFPKVIFGNFDENGSKSDIFHTQPTKLVTGQYFEQAKLFLLSSDEARRKISFDCGEVTARVAKLLPRKTLQSLHAEIANGGIMSLFSLFESSFSSVSISKGSKFELRGKFEGMFFLNELELRQCEICNMKGLSDLKNLRELRLNDNQISKIEGLRELINLKWLLLDNNQISKIEGLSELKNLGRLELNKNQISKIEGLSDLKNLKRLDLRNNQISKIEGLSELKNIEVLELNNNQISKIEGLSDLKNLRELYLNDNQISKIERLSDLKNLEKLYLNNNNRILKIEGLSALKNLRRLELNDNQISKIEGLNELKNLKWLLLDNNQISKIEGLSELKNLEKLDLSDNQISKIEGVSELKNLDVLDLRNNQISKIEGLNELKNLKWFLLLDNNQISKIEGLSELKNLDVLDLRNNQISKIEGLSELKNLKWLLLDNNQISKIEGLSELKNLEKLDLSDNQISKIEGVSELKNLQVLKLRRNVNLEIPSGIKVESNGEIWIRHQSHELLSKCKWQDLSKKLRVKIKTTKY